MFKKLKDFFTPKRKQAKFVCSCCGKEHDNWPALGYNSPTYYSDLSDEDKETLAELNSDVCIIRHSDQTDRFVRGVLEIPVHDSCQNLSYGIWVSLSENSFEDYVINLDNENREGGYFGWICNNLEGYKTTLSIPSDVYLEPNGLRPLIVPHQSHEHPLVDDYYNGISIAEAEKRINAVIQNSGN
jgi:hypothetical protein